MTADIIYLSDRQAQGRAQRAPTEGVQAHDPSNPKEALQAAAAAAASLNDRIDKMIVRIGTGKPNHTLDEYLDNILDQAYNGSQWAQFRLALIQLADEEPGVAREQMLLTFPNIEPATFDGWLESASREFDEYSDILNKE